MANNMKLVEQAVTAGAVGKETDYSKELAMLLLEKAKRERALEIQKEEQEKNSRRQILEDDKRIVEGRNRAKRACPHTKAGPIPTRLAGQTTSDFRLNLVCQNCGMLFSGPIGGEIKDEFGNVMPGHLMPPGRMIGGAVSL